MENKKKEGKKRFYSVFYPWQKKPATEEEDLKKRLKQLRGVNNVLVVMIFGFLAITIITAQWAGLIVVVVFLFFLFGTREEKKRIEAKLGIKDKI